MKDKSLNMARNEGSRIARMQGGTNVNQGPMGSSSVKTGDGVKSPHTSHDMAMCKQGGKGRKILRNS